ncbi:MAG: hypothetical protein ACJ8H8_00655 [Geminicoccaceae bacterium]
MFASPTRSTIRRKSSDRLNSSWAMPTSRSTQPRTIASAEATMIAARLRSMPVVGPLAESPLGNCLASYQMFIEATSVSHR